MLNENIKALRSARGLSQEELSKKLNVVRQTLSKWERGTSMPDARMLIRLADILDVPVSRLLGEDMPSEAQRDTAAIAKRLERINGELAAKNHRSRRVLLWLSGILLALSLFLGVKGLTPLSRGRISFSIPQGLIGGADGPTSIFIVSSGIDLKVIIACIIILAASVAGFIAARRK